MYFRVVGNRHQNITHRAERARRNWWQETVKRAIVKQGRAQEQPGMKAKKARLELSSKYERFRLPRLSEMAKWEVCLYADRNITFYLLLFKKESNPMNTTAVTSAATTAQCEREPVKLLRIGSTTYEVSVHFSNVETETMEDKLLRLIEREVDKNA